MKRIIFTFFLLVHCGQAFADSSVYVQVKAAKLRASPMPWASSIATLHYGDPLTKLGGDDAWWNVKNHLGQKGYISAASATDKQVVLKAGGYIGGNAVDTNDVVMAGKGFSKEIEEQFSKSGHGNYAAVNRLESKKANEGQVRQFLKEGKLS